MLKYTVPADEADIKATFAGKHKPGFFRSEHEIVKEVWQATGLSVGQRHLLSYVVEACDDIAYSVMDAEDTVKKDLASFADVMDHLSSGASREGDPRKKTIIDAVVKYAMQRRSDLSKTETSRISPAELDDLSMQYLRASAISQMVRAVLKALSANYTKLNDGTFEGELIEQSEAAGLRYLLKEFLKDVAFQHRSVLEIELRGAIVIEQLMDRLWAAIINRADRSDLKSERADPLSRYTYGRISENYRRVFEDPTTQPPIRYREAQLLTDMISGMTDSFAMSLLDALKGFEGDTAN